MESYRTTVYTETEPVDSQEVTELVSRLSAMPGDPGDSATLGVIAEATGTDLSVAAQALREIRHSAIEPPSYAWEQPEEAIAPPIQVPPISTPASYLREGNDSASVIPVALVAFFAALGIVGFLVLLSAVRSPRYDPSQDVRITELRVDGDVTRDGNGNVIVKLKSGGTRPASDSETRDFITLEALMKARH